MINQPLTHEQIWGVPEEQLPEPEIKDYFEYGETEENQAAEDRPEDGPGCQGGL